MSDEQDFSSLVRAFASEGRRFEVADALLSMGGRAVEPLLAALELENWRIRGNAAWTLGKIGDTRAIGALIGALADEVPEVRAIAGRALIDIGEPAVIPLREFVEKSDHGPNGLAHCILSCLEADGADDATEGCTTT